MDDPTVNALVETYGMNAEGQLRGEGSSLSILLNELERAQKALDDEKQKPIYMFSDLL